MYVRISAVDGLATHAVYRVMQCRHCMTCTQRHLVESVLVWSAEYGDNISLLETKLLILVVVRGVSGRVIPVDDSHLPGGVGRRVPTIDSWQLRERV